MIEVLRARGLVEGAEVVVRHSAPFCEEPHRVRGEILSIKLKKSKFPDWLFGKESVTLTVETEALGKITISGVTPENMSLVIDPYSIEEPTD